MQKRKNENFDGTDREILRTLYKERPLVSRQIAKSIGLSASAIAPRLNNLKTKGIIKQTRVERIRSFKRTFGSQIKIIKAPRSIFWDLDLKI